MNKLTPKQASFVENYMTCRNGAEAARKAMYAVSSARITASKLLSKTNIKAAIAYKQAELARITAIDRNRVVKELLTGIAVAKQNMNGGQMISGWMNVARMLGLVTPDVKAHSKGLSAENRALEARMELLSDAELIEIAEGRTTI